MSRIVGLASRQNTSCRNNNDNAWLHSMLASAQGTGWIASEVEVESFAGAWTGWRHPIVACEGDLACVVDGVFFNGNELDGTSANDAEMLIALFRKHGFVEALTKINGDFAVALFDGDSKSLWLGRDRIGVKPLYYTTQLDFVAFASRPKSLLGLPGVSNEINRQFAALFAASHYRTFDNDPESSPYADIRQVPAAHAICFKNGSVTKHRYWQLEDLPDWTGSEEELAEQYRALLLDAVGIRYRAAQRPAFTLSGGMDSSTVLSFAVHLSGKKQHAISTIYKDKTYDESEDIQTILDQTVEQWHTVSLDVPDVLGTVEKMIDVHDEPVATATWLSHYLLCQIAAERGFGSLFGGLGGDELNAGEYEYFWYHFADLKSTGQEARLNAEITKWIEYHDHPIFRKSFDLVGRDLGRLADFSQRGRCLPDENRMRRYYSALNAEYFDLQPFIPLMDHPFQSFLKNRTYQDIFRETAPCCLRAEDRQATAFGLDNNLPFFDYRIVEFMFRVPGHLKIRDGVTKRLLRTATKGIVPDETRNRIAKTGWNAPAHVWFSGKGAEPLLDLINSRRFRERGIYDISEVDRIVKQHEQIVSSGEITENHMMFLWQLVNLELWCQSLAGSVQHEKQLRHVG